MKDKSVKKKLAPEKELGLGEPYWPQGDWVFLRTMFPTTTVKNYRGTTTNPMGRTCDRICNHYYEQYGKICAHRYNTKKWQNEYRNFTNLCDLDHVNCNDTQIKPSWHLLHRGDCEELKEMVLLPRGNPKTILARAKKWAPYTYIPKFQPKRPIKLK
ncbi:uncharacterized protein LOC124643824 [Helicoverpa zea]|uniref:uncharacterized protein LOC124643824 n=1 Tax=Helicoverpa zea TaxID=7113 RepID=UPI001F59869C|nr:uncharacterized protein LOC124643824 [Helicoverpa zea]